METTAGIREYLFDIGKIVEGALGADREKVLAYVSQLRDKLSRDGMDDAAKRFEQLIRNGHAKGLVPAKSGAASHARLPVDTESRLPTADVEVLHPGEAEVFLPAEVRSVVDKFMAFVKASDKLTANGVGISASLLVHGPSGCGKTQLARHIAATLELPLVTARSDTLISSYLGSTSKNIRALFDHAMSRPCVLFLDEFDALGKMRDDSRELGELKRVVISLLQNIDAMRGAHVLLAATNHPHLLDPAIWRRFAYRLELPQPNADARRRILQRTLRQYADSGLLELIVPLTDQLSGADCQELAEDAVRTAVLANEPTAGSKSLVDAILARRVQGIESKTLSERVQAMRSLLPSVSQAQIGELIGVSQGQVSKLLKGSAGAR